MNNILMFLRLYQGKYHYRILLIIVISTLIWFFFSNKKISDAVISLVIVAGFEYMTINVIFKREFYPLDLFADKWFVKDSRGYKVLYLTYYFAFWLAGIYALYIEWK